MKNYFSGQTLPILLTWRDRILVQVTIYRRLRSQDGHLDQSEAYDIS